ncbi:MAG TPA: patatin-like phospholipase family protein [Steroidobacteraceae bacterium]|nr:patatin-like phospholipase family protein [Steroidobacteraceae bacterium]
MTMTATYRHFVGSLVLWAFVALAGCASVGPQLPIATDEDLAAPDASLAVRTLAPDGEFELLPASTIVRRLQDRLSDRPITILALSGGGASGAFGAGAVVGLTRHGSRPEFSVVTGVSAGALIAPLAFLGAAWDPQIAAIYTDGVDRSLLQPRLIGAVFGSSVYSATPLRRLIEHYADDALIDAVGAQAARGRLLLVATTDFATGDAVIWDLGSIALYGGADRGPLFRDVLLASASVPGVFPPVAIKVRTRRGTREETHVDGGVTLPFFVAPSPQDLPRSATPGAPSAIVRVIIDGRLRDLPHPARANALSIYRRSVSAGLTHMTRTTLERTVAVARRHGVSLEYAAIPASYPLPGALDFAQDGQRALFSYAAACAETGRLWTSIEQDPREGVADGNDVTGGTTCPADDRFIARLAALGD